MASPGAQASLELKKKWYQGRAESNLEIGNYKAAIEAYEKVLEADPDDTGAMKSLGVAYEKQGLKDKAIAQFDRYLEKNPNDAEIAYRQAEALEWSRYSYRKQDALKYYRMGLKEKPDNAHRLKYARLLAANRSTNDEAIEQYRAVLRSNPRSGAAHQGLARAYAWNGQNDKAVYHSELAKEYGASRSDLKRLDRDLSKGREPRAGGEFNFMTQPGGDYDFSGFRLGALGQTELGAFVTMRAQAGMENFWRTGTESASGGYFNVGADYRIDEQSTARMSLGYHSIMPTISGRQSTADVRNLTLQAQYEQRADDGFTFVAGFDRSLRQDSYLALVGTSSLGAARSQMAYVDLNWKGETVDFGVKPYFGWVTALNVNPNVMLGADGNVSFRLLQQGNTTLSLGDSMQIAHYAEDQSALSGASAAGYFSPRLYVNQSPNLSLRLNFSDSHEAFLAAGPSFQYVDDNSLAGAWQLGANVRVGYQAKFASRFLWKADGSYSNIAEKFNRLQIENSVSYMF